MTNKFPIKTSFWLEASSEITFFVHRLATSSTLLDKQYQGSYETVMQERVPKFFAALILRHSAMLQINTQTDLRYEVI